MVSASENIDDELKCRLTRLKPYTNYTIWCRSVGQNGDVSESTQPIQLTTEQEGKRLLIIIIISFFGLTEAPWAILDQKNLYRQ